MTIQILQHILLALSVFFGVCYFYQTVYLFLPLFGHRKRAEDTVPAAQLRYGILVAARNEQAVLPYLLDSIRAQDYPGSVTPYVIADNCTDATAAVARSHGAVVYERHDTSRIGKGYALNYLLGRMEADGALEDIDAFLVFDADNLLAGDYVSQINRTFARGFEAVCGYRNSKNFMDNWLSAGYGLWYIHDGAHLNASRMRLGVTCAVSGTGFGFTRGLLDKCGGWRFFALTEDVEFDTWCAVNGVRIGYCGEAVVYDEQPTDFAQSWRQRTRWIQGSIQVGVRYFTQLTAGLFGKTDVRTKYSCFENMTLTAFGYGAGGLSAFAAGVTAFLASGRIGVLLLPLLSAAAMMFFMGALTTAMEWRRIPGTAAQKLKSVLTFPLFMLTFIPIALWACVSKYQWKPIHHTVAVGVESMNHGALTKL